MFRLFSIMSLLVTSRSKDVPYTNLAQRAPRFVSKEPPEVEAARLLLGQASSQEERRTLARFLYRAKRK